MDNRRALFVGDNPHLQWLGCARWSDQPCPDDEDWSGTLAMNELWAQAHESGVALEADDIGLSLTGDGVALFFVRS